MGPNTANTAYTIMAWVSLPLPGTSTWVGVLSSNTESRWFEVQRSGGALLIDYFGGSGQVTASSTFPVNTPTHIAVAVTGTSSGTIYINGSAAGTATGIASSGANFSASDWKIGAGNGDVGPRSVVDRRSPSVQHRADRR